jgi:integrase
VSAMTADALSGSTQAPALHGSASEGQQEQLALLLDPVFLKAIGWDAARQAFTPPSEHPQLGSPVCLVAGCDVLAHHRLGLCPSCRGRYRSSGLDLADFILIDRARAGVRFSGTLPCAVAGCGRPSNSAPTKLCNTHRDQRRRLALPLDAFLNHPAVRPLPSLGECRAAACTGPADGGRRLCRVHDNRFRSHRRNHPNLDLDHWCRTQQPPRNDATRVVLLGLPALVQIELLYGLQERCRRGSKTPLTTIRTLCEVLRHDQVQSILDLAVPLPQRAPSQNRARRDPRYELAIDVQTAIRRTLSSPELERGKDVWDMVVFGHRGTLDFTRITHAWLRQAAMEWANEDAPKRRGTAVTNILRYHVKSLELLSASLRLQRDDRGTDLTVLGRADIVAFLNRLSHLETAGEISAYQRRNWIRQAAKVLRDCRALGLTRPGRPLAGLPDDFALLRGDAPSDPDDPEQGRALPPVVLEQLVAALPRLQEDFGREAAVSLQLLIDTGRRPDEICKLPWNCLEQGPDGKYALVYTDFKNNRVGVKLAIADATARLIIQQQQAVRGRFPDTPAGDLVLLPRAYRNSDGTCPTTEYNFAKVHRRWVNNLPMLRSGIRAEDGTEVEFDKRLVVPYAYRHTYAQRHADAGTSVDVLCELMGHDSMATTQGYYRVTVKRTRAAVDRLAALQFDGRGNRVWLEARTLFEHEHQRRAVGQVAVPFGICTEPSNVQAGGHACPFRFRCVGCGHFRSDPSYLPELRGYLEMLLRNRERVRAAVELDEWARAEATPSDEEISRLRALIRRAETDLEQLSGDERSQIDEACRVVRATRQTVHLGMPTIRPPDLDPSLEGLA